mmetsp:Transcript_37352/g.43479  ORF Transcript_37352/g.43479 Transcript_37352/m.43479 type:complete len:136 (-) Transcript_37352:231-638(-)
MYQISTYYNFIVVPKLEYIFGFSSRKKHSYIQNMHCFMELYLDNEVILVREQSIRVVHARDFFSYILLVPNTRKIIFSLITNRLNSRTQSAVYIEFIGVHTQPETVISVCVDYSPSSIPQQKTSGSLAPDPSQDS